jgi:hypothetical protein
MTSESGQGKDAKRAWDDVGKQFSDVGKRISERYRGEKGQTGTTAESEQRAVGDAIQRVVDQLDQTFTALGNALRDPETTEGLRQASRSLSQALDATFSGVGGELRRRFGRKGPSEGPDRPGEDAGPART